tara:strand:+ start:115 stop:1371 length:1257 start_codon:yes stop_codon:yes gene_type:complete
MINKKRLTVYFVFCLSLFVGLFLGENSSGGAKIDHSYLLSFIENFSINFKYGFAEFLNQPSSLIHSPSFYLISGFLLKVTQNLLIVKIFNIIISCFIPYIFFLILKTKYKTQSDYIFYFSLLIFLSPYFRSSAIWLLNENLSLFFFSLSILFFNKIKNQKDKILNYYLCFTFLILCSYIRYYYCVFSIYYLIYFYRNLDLRNILKLISFSFLLSLPAFYYLYYTIINHSFLVPISIFGTFNYYTNTLIILTILLFYLFPFILKDSYLIFDYYKDKYKNIFFVLIIFSIIYLIDYFLLIDLINLSPRGGGVFLKISNILNFDSSLFLTVIAFFSIFIIDYLFKNNRLDNYMLLITLILCLPLFTLYQEYLDPLFYLLFFGLANSTYLKNLVLKESINLTFIYLYFFSFYLFSLIYYRGL